jgi:signal transduction histidine kinase
MNPEEQATLFDAFGAASETDARAHGTGLELALAKRLVELQGGTISFTSTRGIGTTFTVTLPKTVAATDDADKG